MARGEWMGWKRWLGLERAAPGGSRALGADEVVRLPRGSAVRVEAGMVVITREGDPADHVLEAGETLELAARGRALAWALAPSRIALGARSATSIIGWRQGSSTASSASPGEARPSDARPWPAPRPS